MKGRNITQEQVNQMNNLFYIKGMSAVGIAETMGISPQCVYRYTKLDKKGNPPKPAGVLTSNQKKRANRNKFFANIKKEDKVIVSNKSHSLNARKEAYSYVCDLAKTRNLSKIDAMDLVIERAKRRCLFNW